MPTPDSPPGPYRYELDLVTLDLQVARFVYVDAPALTADDTALDLNRASWEALGRPGRLAVTIDRVNRQ